MSPKGFEDIEQIIKHLDSEQEKEATKKFIKDNLRKQKPENKEIERED